MTAVTYEALRRAGAQIMGARAALEEAREGELREAHETRERTNVSCTRGGAPGQDGVNDHAANMLCSRAIARATMLVTEAYEIIA